MAIISAINGSTSDYNDTGGYNYGSASNHNDARSASPQQPTKQLWLESIFSSSLMFGCIPKACSKLNFHPKGGKGMLLYRLISLWVRICAGFLCFEIQLPAVLVVYFRKIRRIVTVFRTQRPMLMCRGKD